MLLNLNRVMDSHFDHSYKMMTYYNRFVFYKFNVTSRMGFVILN